MTSKADYLLETASLMHWLHSAQHYSIVLIVLSVKLTMAEVWRSAVNIND